MLCLGDSNTFGRGVAEEDTYPAQLEDELVRRASSAVVWNAGVCGYNTENLAVVREIHRTANELGARLIVIVYVGQSAIVQRARGDVVARVEAALRADGIEVLSAYDLFAADFETTGRDLCVVRDRGHPNGAGHALTARAVADLVLQ